MKRKIQLAALLVWMSVTTISLSCKRDNDNNTSKTKTELLTAGSWKRTALISNPAYDWYGDGTFATDNLSVMKPCEKDNSDTYKANGTGEYNEGATKCDGSDPQSWSFTWKFADNETRLIFDGSDEYTLIELTATTLIYKSTFTENGVTYTQVETYGH